MTAIRLDAFLIELHCRRGEQGKHQTMRQFAQDGENRSRLTPPNIISFFPT